MASRTQLRLSQITGSYAATNTNRIITVEPKSTLANIVAFDLSGSLSHIASAIQRIHGKGSGEAFDNTAGEFYQNLTIDTGGAASLTIGGGDNADMKLVFDQDTQDYYIGVDADDADKFVFGRGTAVGTNGDLIIDSSGNVTISNNLTVSGETTTVNTTNLTVEDSIIGLGITGSTFNNAGDRGFIFARGTVGAALPGFWWDGSQFNLASSLTSPASASFQATSDYKKLQVGDLAIYNGVNKRGDIKVVNDDLVISSSAGNDLMLDSNSGKIFLQKDTIAAGFLQADAGESGNGLILSSSVNEALVLDSNVGLIQFGSSVVETEGLKVSTTVAGGATEETFSFIKSDDTDDTHFTLQVETHTGGTFANQFVGVSGSLRLFEENHGQGYVGLRTQTNTGTSYNIQFPTGIGSANEVLTIGSVDGSNALMSFSAISSLTAPSKGVKIIGAAGVGAGADVNFNSVDVGDTISGMLNNDATQGRTIDVYVNGQLMLSGSSAEASGATPTRDFFVHDATTLRFAFDLEADDVVTLIKR